MSGVPPFNGSSDQEILKRVRLGRFSFNNSNFDKVSNAAKDFIRRLLTKDVNERPSAEEALSHPWILSGKNAKLKKSVPKFLPPLVRKNVRTAQVFDSIMQDDLLEKETILLRTKPSQILKLEHKLSDSYLYIPENMKD